MEKEGKEERREEWKEERKITIGLHSCCRNSVAFLNKNDTFILKFRRHPFAIVDYAIQTKVPLKKLYNFD